MPRENLYFFFWRLWDLEDFEEKEAKPLLKMVRLEKKKTCSGFSSKVDWYLELFIIHFTLTKDLVPPEDKQPQTMILPPPYFTKGMVLFWWCKVIMQLIMNLCSLCRFILQCQMAASPWVWFSWRFYPALKLLIYSTLRWLLLWFGSTWIELNWKIQFNWSH